MSTSCGEAIVHGLAARGVDVVFGIPGVHTLELYRGLEAAGVRHVAARHEQGAAFMADGYGRATGRPGVALVISGPGVTNALTPLAQARHDARPLLLLSAVVRSGHAGRDLGVIHDLPDQAAASAAIAVRTLTVGTPAEVDDVLDEAFAAMAGGPGRRPGPVHVQVPVDVLREPAAPARAPAAAPGAAAPDDDDLERAAALLAGARRPALVLGGGARAAGAEAVALAERLGAPLGLTINAKGAVPAEHPLCVPSRMTFAPADALFREADVLLCVGTQLSDLDWWALPGPLVPDGAVIRVDLDPRALHANVRAEVGIVGDAAATLAALAARLGAAEGGAARDAAAARVADALGRLDWPEEIAIHLPLVRALDAALGSERIVCVDSTQPGYAANHALDVSTPAGWQMPIGFGCLGCALPMAIGAKVAAPERPVLALAGDGGVLFTIAELGTARDLGLGLPVVVWDNAGYGEIRDAMAVADVPPIGTDVTAHDLVRIAEGFGCRGVDVDDLARLPALIGDALAASAPTLLRVSPATRGIR